MDKINLEDQVICNYLVTKQMKEVWQCQLDMMEQLDNICKKYNIKYFLAAGTLIGAIRHKGYIPWDDDIDVVMLRNEYERFLEVADKELKGKYFFQSYRTERKYQRAHSQIRNSETTAIINGDKYNKFNKGIFIDIFPLDNVPDDEKEAKEFLNNINKKKKFLDNYYNIESTSTIKKFIKIILHRFLYLFVDYDKKIEEYERLISKYKNFNTKRVSNIAFDIELPKFNKEWFDKVIYMDFEYMRLPCPANYDEILRMQYGDYMKIPEKKGGSVHGTVFFDTKKSYKEYENKKEYKKVEEYLK